MTAANCFWDQVKINYSARLQEHVIQYKNVAQGCVFNIFFCNIAVIYGTEE